MARATTQALAATTAALAGIKGVTLETAQELFSAARLVSESSQLSGALADSAATPEARKSLVAAAFAKASAPAAAVLAAVAAERWSSPADLVSGLEELAIRAAAISSGDADVSGELFGVVRLVANNPELELALGSRLGSGEVKTSLAQRLLERRVSPATALIVGALVRTPRDRRVRTLLNRASKIVADARGQVVATVHTAASLSEAQRTKLEQALSGRYGRTVTVNEVIDPEIVGGLRVQVADDVIDGSVSSRLAELRHSLAS